ncbi:MAG: hypothetical protein ACTHJJ_02020 [Intrasporangium sp.]|uniref:hypothetical protein n=1 Tax=Intrasporangium sp. TaxID=1925024 RepID=UPI003F800582
MRSTLGRVVAGAAAWWVVGALPFLLTGLRLPLQNLWDTEQAPESMPRVALPLSQYLIGFLVAIGIVGGVAAALTGLTAPPERRRRGVRAALSGAALAAAVSLAQTSIVVRNGLDGSKRAELYLSALVAVTVVGAVLGLVVGHAVAVGRPGARAIGVALLSTVLGGWLGTFLLLRGSAGSGVWQALYTAIPWVTAVVAGIGLALCPPRSRSAVLAWVGALVVVWVVPVILTAVSYVAGSRAMLATSPPSEWLDAGWAVFRAALAPANHPLWPLALTIAVGLVGLARLRPGAPASVTEDRARTVDP